MSAVAPSAGDVIAPVLLGGEARRMDRSAPVVNPARFDEVVGRVAEASPGDVDEAVRLAVRAGGEWAALDAAERGRLLEQAADAVAERVDELGLLLSREQGKTLVEARSDVGGAPLVLRYYAGLTALIDEERVTRSDERGSVRQRRLPIGPVGVIVPWNSPVHLAFLGIGPALAAGNAVIVKPSSFAPLALSEVLATIARILPPGLISNLPGSNDVGAAIAGHDGIRKIFFTGSTATGKRIMQSASGNLKRLSLELGGNDAAIVLADARIDEGTITELVRGTFALSGQVCFGIKRIYVDRARYREVRDGFVDVASRIVVGEGAEPGVSMGPVNNRPQYERVRTLIESARSSGATLVETGVAHPGAAWSEGYFIRPTVVSDIDPDAPLVREEQFGPAVPIVPVDDEAEAIAAANSTEFGLGASVWSADDEHALAVARRIQAGSVFVNAHRAGVSDVTMPFGGVKQSGLGRGHGIPALESCVETQVIGTYQDRSAFPPSPIG